MCEKAALVWFYSWRNLGFCIGIITASRQTADVKYFLSFHSMSYRYLWFVMSTAHYITLECASIVVTHLIHSAVVVKGDQEVKRGPAVYSKWNLALLQTEVGGKCLFSPLCVFGVKIKTATGLLLRLNLEERWWSDGRLYLALILDQQPPVMLPTDRPESPQIKDVCSDSCKCLGCQTQE